MTRIRRRGVPSTRRPSTPDDIDMVDLSLGPAHRRASMDRPADAPEWSHLRAQWAVYRAEFGPDSFGALFFDRRLSYHEAKRAAGAAWSEAKAAEDRLRHPSLYLETP